MVHENSCGRLENEFKRPAPVETDLVICIKPQGVAVKLHSPLAEAFPTVGEVAVAPEQLQYLFRFDARNFYLYTGEETLAEEFPGVHPRNIREVAANEVSYAAFTGWHLATWYRSNRFCNRCGGHTHHDEKERMLRCDSCGNLIFPRINPVVIVAITHGDRILLTKYANRGYTEYALVAGFTEIGETLEQTVEREVMEEVGLKVTNVRYYKSQPWGVDSNLLMGFFCDVEGSDSVTLDNQELALGQWFHRSEIPIPDDNFSLTREMIRVFQEGKEPK